jgi:integrase
MPCDAYPIRSHRPPSLCRCQRRSTKGRDHRRGRSSPQRAPAVKLICRQPTPAPPKRAKTRDVPLAEVVAVATSEHLRKYGSRGGGLFFTSREQKPIPGPTSINKSGTLHSHSRARVSELCQAGRNKTAFRKVRGNHLSLYVIYGDLHAQWW